MHTNKNEFDVVFNERMPYIEQQISFSKKALQTNHHISQAGRRKNWYLQCENQGGIMFCSSYLNTIN